MPGMSKDAAGVCVHHPSTISADCLQPEGLLRSHIAPRDTPPTSNSKCRIDVDVILGNLADTPIAEQLKTPSRR